MGVALTSCSLPGKPADNRIAVGQMEVRGSQTGPFAGVNPSSHPSCRIPPQVGLGIHGEPGAAVAPLSTANEVVDHLLATITSQAAMPYI